MKKRQIDKITNQLKFKDSDNDKKYKVEKN